MSLPLQSECWNIKVSGDLGQKRQLKLEFSDVCSLFPSKQARLYEEAYYSFYNWPSSSLLSGTRRPSHVFSMNTLHFIVWEMHFGSDWTRKTCCGREQALPKLRSQGWNSLPPGKELCRLLGAKLTKPSKPSLRSHYWRSMGAPSSAQQQWWG